MHSICSAHRARRWPAGLIAAALALTTAPAALGATSAHHTAPLTAAGWHGREIREPMPARALGIAVRWPRGWTAGGVRPGTGDARADGSRRVRELQRRLRRRGYRPGPVDGRFGPRTRSALVWFQIKHGLPQTGTVDVHTLAAIHSRPVPPPRAPAPRWTVTAATPTPEPAGQTTLGPAAIAVAVLTALLALVCAVASRRRRVRDTVDAGPECRGAPPPAAARRRLDPPPAGPAQVLGYAAGPASQARSTEIELARATGAWCQRPAGVLGREGDGTLDVRCGQPAAVVIAAGRAAGIGPRTPAATTRSPFPIRQAEVAEDE